MEIKNITLPSVIKNITSGRFILTMTGSVSFFIITNTLCRILLEKAKDIQLSDLLSIFSTILIILSNIFTFYFVKSNLQKNSNNGDNNEGRNNESSNQTSSSNK